MDYTLNACFIRVFYNGQEITTKFEGLRYVASEEDDDECFLTLRSDDRNEADKPEWQTGAILKISWGFIGTTQIANRLVVVQDVDWTYDKDNITAELQATEKGASLKYSSSDGVYRDTSLIGVAKEIADKHGLKTKVELPNKEDKDNGTPKSSEEALGNLINLGEKITMPGGVGQYLPSPEVKVLVTEDFVKLLRENAKNRREVDSVSKLLYGITYQDFLDQKAAGGAINLLPIQKEIHYMRYVKDMKTYPFVAQGNKTDKQMLNELGMKENGGPFIAETRDDELIIRRRNWNKKPYKAYEYGGAIGDLIDYHTDPKDRNRKHAARNMTFGAWDPLNKRYLEGNANAINDATRASISKFEKLFDNYKKVVEKFPNVIVGFRDATREIGSPRGSTSSNIIGTAAKSDETRVLKEIRIPIFAIDKLRILEKTVNELKGISPNKKIVDANNDGIEDAYQQASNLRNNSDMKKHPITAKLYGDVGLWPGEILTITGVGRKYSGNHYVTKADHVVSPSQGYIVATELARKGNNIKTSDDDVSTVEVGKTLNNEMGPNKTEGSKKTITVK